MIHPCDKPCGNKTANGYCATTACINPQYSNLGTAQYGQWVQKRIVSNADRIRAMTDEELAEFLETLCPSYNWTMALNGMTWFGWLKQEVDNGDG